MNGKRKSICVRKRKKGEYTVVRPEELGEAEIKEMVRSLRICGMKDTNGCDQCGYFGRDFCQKRITIEAADLIEWLLEKNASLESCLKVTRNCKDYSEKRIGQLEAMIAICGYDNDAIYR